MSITTNIAMNNFFSLVVFVWTRARDQNYSFILNFFFKFRKGCKLCVNNPLHEMICSLVVWQQSVCLLLMYIKSVCVNAIASISRWMIIISIMFIQNAILMLQIMVLFKIHSHNVDSHPPNVDLYSTRACADAMPWLYTHSIQLSAQRWRERRS